MRVEQCAVVLTTENLYAELLAADARPRRHCTVTWRAGDQIVPISWDLHANAVRRHGRVFLMQVRC